MPYPDPGAASEPRSRRLILQIALLAVLLAAIHAPAQEPASPLGAAVPHRYIVAYRNNIIPASAQAFARSPGITIFHRHPPVGIVVLETDPGEDEAATLAALGADPAVEFVIHDRILSAHNFILRPTLSAVVSIGAPPAPSAAPYDTYYTATPQNWAVVQAGGYGAAIPGGPAHGPWNAALGAGIRIAILDSGVDATHPDIASNLAFSFSEIDQSPSTGLPSPCDDGSPQDQQGHGTWTASLAAGTMGRNTGLVIGVAPGAAILNIKVLERLPDPASTAPEIATQCAAGQAGGLLSWVIQGDGPPSEAAHSFGCFNLGHTPYLQAMGTSASAALAAGAAALVRAAHPTWTPDQVVTAVRATATPTASLPGAPVLNLAALIP